MECMGQTHYIFTVWTHFEIFFTAENCKKNVQQGSCNMSRHTLSMLMHYLELLEIHFHAVLQKMLFKSLSYVLKIKRFMSYGWIDIDTVTTVAHGVHYMLQTCLKIPKTLINCPVNIALVSGTVPRHTHTSVH